MTPTGLTILKVGGSLDIDAIAGLLDEVAAFPDPLVVVHGAHRQLDRIATALGHPPWMVTSPRGELSRFTDRESMDHFLMAYCGLVNKRLVEVLRRRGADAVGISAMDGGIALGRRRADIRVIENGRIKVLHGDHAGSIEVVDPSLLQLLLASGRLPVLTPPAITRDGTAINVDGDRLAAEVAVALGARRLWILMSAPGLLRDPEDDESLVARIAADRVDDYLSLAHGRVRVKVLAARRALEGGVAEVVLADGREDAPLRRCAQGAGTRIQAPNLHDPGSSRRS